jgi:hypothetical protein
MSTVTTFKCDMCDKDLTTGTKDHMFRINLYENLLPYQTAPEEEQPVLKPELDEMKHFCNIACLKGWVNKE